jgi:thiol:disulfide interchange protein DsbD
MHATPAPAGGAFRARDCVARLIRSSVAWLVAVAGLAAGSAALAAQDEFLDPDVAFQFSAQMVDGHTVEARWKIADGYYMYHERFGFDAQTEAGRIALGAAQLPPGKVKFDTTFNKNVETHRGALVVRIPVTAGSGPFTLVAGSQGCADAGLCYPPQQQQVALVATATAPSAPSAAAVAAPAAGSAITGSSSDEGRIEAALKSGSLLTVVPLFALFGLLLSFTPCVLPMIPILSSIIVGDRAAAAGSKARGFSLALAYSLGMALVYTALGVAAGLAGEGLAAALQAPAVLATFGALLLLLALSMFGFYELQLPASLQARLANLSNAQRAGSHAGVFAMGAISALIVGPCVAAPLAGALLYISQTRDVVVGGAALFAMACGMSVPLLLVGLSAGSLLPRAGKWMENVKKFFGVLLIATAIWMVSPVLPAWLHMLAWAALAIVCAVYLRVFDPLPEAASGWTRFAKGVGALLMLGGSVQVVGVATGGRDVLMPLGPLAARPAANAVATAPAASESARWVKVANVGELDAALARTAGRPVLLDFYADWCVSCKEMERFTFAEQRVAAQMENMLLLKADVTANSPEHRELMKRFSLFGPPGIILFDAQGREVPGARVVGFKPAEEFLATLQRASTAASLRTGALDGSAVALR